MSADSTSTEKPAGDENVGPEGVVDSADQSLLAIMKEVQQADGPAAADLQAIAPQTVEGDGASATEAGTSEVAPADQAQAAQPEAPDAVSQTAESDAWKTEPTAAPGRQATESPAISDSLQAGGASDDEPLASATSDPEKFESAEAEVDAESEMDAESSEAGIELSEAEKEPSEVGVELTIEELEAEAVVESILATARTSHHDAEQTLGAAPAFAEDAPPSDEVLLANIVLPAAFSSTPSMIVAGESARSHSLEEVGDEDRTTISSLPPEIALAPARLPAPIFAASEKVRRVTPTWPGTETVTPAPQQFGRLPRPPVRGWVRMARQVAGHRVNTSVAQLAIVVVSATAFGAAAGHLMNPAPPANQAAAAAMIPDRAEDLHLKALPPRPPEIAPLPPAVVEVVDPQPIEVEQPKPRLARKRVIRVQAPAGDVTAERGAEAAAADPTSQTAAPPRKTTAAKPRTRHVAQQGGAWVDPFGD
jgi:hypothetical protein